VVTASTIVDLLTRQSSGSVERRDLEDVLTTVARLVATKLGDAPVLARFQAEVRGDGLTAETRIRLTRRLEFALDEEVPFSRELLETAERAERLISGDVSADRENTGEVTNTITGTVNGNVIQAHNITGSIVFGSPLGTGDKDGR
jgi:hypothetical protein